MAEAAKYPTKLEETVTCPVCFECMRDTRSLYPCLHTFCARCVSQLNRKRKQGHVGIECPLCREFIQENDIRMNRLMNDLINMVIEDDDVERDKTEHACLQCDSKAVTSKCLSCNIHLCNKCKDTHRKIPGFKEHRVLPLTESHQEKPSLTVFCDKHPGEQIRVNCVPCDMAICSICKLNDHDTHPSENLFKTVSRYRKKFKESLEMAKRNTATQSSKLASLKAYKEKLQVNEAEVTEQIQNHKERMLAIVNAKCKALVNQVEEGTATKLKEIDLEMEELENDIACDNSITTWSETILEKLDGSALVTELQSGLMKQVTQLEKKPNSKLTRQINTPVYVFNPLEITEKQPILGYLEEVCDETSTSEVKTNFRVSKSLDLSKLTSSKLSRVRKTDIGYYTSKMCIIDNQIWLYCDRSLTRHNENDPEEYCMKIFSLNCEYIRKFKIDGITHIKSFQQLNNDQLILASGEGLHFINKQGTGLSLFKAGHFTDLYFEDNNIAALESSYTGYYDYELEENIYNDVILVNIFDTNNLSEPTSVFEVYDQYGSECSVCISNSQVYIVGDLQNIQQYDLNGVHIRNISLKVGPDNNGIFHFYMIDKQGNMLLLSREYGADNDKLYIWSSQYNTLKMLQLPIPNHGKRLRYIKDAVIVDKSLYVIVQSGNGECKLLKYKINM